MSIVKYFSARFTHLSQLRAMVDSPGSHDLAHSQHPPCLSPREVLPFLASRHLSIVLEFVAKVLWLISRLLGLGTQGDVNDDSKHETK